MKSNKRRELYKFIVFFLLISFVVTCSFLLFMHYMDFDRTQLRTAAPVTFGNVVFITLILFSLDQIRKKIFTDRPIKKINKGLSKMACGDFNTRIDKVSVLSGMTDFNEIVDYINVMAAELESVELLRNDFVSSVSHEMKTPIAVIGNYAQLLQSEDLTKEERVEYATIIEETCHRLSSLVANILKLNKLENQQIYQKKDKVNLSEQICESLLEFEKIWEEKNINIETDIAEDVVVESDEELLRIVWQNLFSNAFKFTDEGGKVFIRLYLEGRDVVVSVKDTGCGMDSETGKHIFEKFYQGDSSHASKGNGIGLALVKRIIDIIGSEISVSSVKGMGTEFVVRLKR